MIWMVAVFQNNDEVYDEGLLLQYDSYVIKPCQVQEKQIFDSGKTIVLLERDGCQKWVNQVYYDWEYGTELKAILSDEDREQLKSCFMENMFQVLMVYVDIQIFLKVRNLGFKRWLHRQSLIDQEA